MTITTVDFLFGIYKFLLICLFITVIVFILWQISTIGGKEMRKIIYKLLQPYFDKIQADIDYLLMLEGEN